MMQNRDGMDDRTEAMRDIAAKWGFTEHAVAEMNAAIVKGGGSMAQFNHAEFGGPGQWMRGGMTMISDMFNSDLKSRVAGLCAELSKLPHEHSMGGALDTPTRPWWPAAWGTPNIAGAQNDSRYAYFRAARRLVIDTGGSIEVYDTADHQISGVAQQQSSDTSLTFWSNDGPLAVETLKTVPIAVD
jgi:hypothetical protein